LPSRVYRQDLEDRVFRFDLLLLFRCFPEVGRGRFCGGALALFSVIFIFWRWLFTLQGGG
jgi:hypothetical protein